MKKIVFLMTALLLISSVGPVFAEDKPIQLSLFNPVQLMPEDASIAGVRLNLIYTKNSSVTGLDIGFLVNHNGTGISKGVQWSLVGIVDGDFVGWQANVVNLTKNNFEGFQWGLVNYAENCNGFQLGFVNYAGTMKGLQIGLVNIIKNGGQFPVFPIVNWSF